MQHMSKCFQAIDRLKLDQAEATPGGPRPKGLGMVSCVGEEYVPFASPLPLEGKVGGAQMGRAGAVLRPASRPAQTPPQAGPKQDLSPACYTQLAQKQPSLHFSKHSAPQTQL
jgi:hypothetical protein